MAGGDRPRTPGVVYFVLSVLLVVLMAAFALTARQPPPPTIAEFAPQAVENITDAPSDQSSSVGRAGGFGAGAAASPEPTQAAAAAPSSVPRVRHCVGDPPRQIEDPQSPPCVPYWSGDNGGATSKGVTRDEIRVVNPSGADLALETFFNKRFEFYGRRVRLLDGSSLRGGGAAAERADAAKADEEFKAFATIHRWFGASTDYYEELARRRVIVAAGKTKWSLPSSKRLSPYVWTYPMHWDRMFRGVGDMLCARLVGRPAVHAGASIAAQRRVFGVIVHNESESGEVTSVPLEQTLRACGARVPVAFTGTDQISPGTASSQLLRMRQEDVTTVVCLCNQGGHPVYGEAATSQGYFPEWVVTSYVGDESNANEKSIGFPPEQREHLLGVSFEPKQNSPENSPPRWASIEGGGNGNPEQYWFDDTYRTLLLVASGIQMAGPRLTPQTFAAGLQRTTFPNPQTPIMAGYVGFQDGPDYSMTQDAAEWWWSNTAPDPTETGSGLGAGAYCYVDGGARRTPGAWPAGEDPFFRPPCDSGS